MIDVRDVAWVCLNAEVHECDFELQELADLNVLSLLLDNLVCVLLEKAENIKVASDAAHHGFIVALRRELGELLHERDEDVLDVHVDVKVGGRVEELLERLQVILVWEGLDHTFHEILLG